MKRLAALFALVLLSFAQPVKYFSGKIIYLYKFKDVKGNDITEAMSAILGKEQHYYINDKNYKAYDEKENLVQLYNSATNTYYQVTKDKKVHKVDASMVTSSIFTVKKLAETEKVANYLCNEMEVTTDDAITTYYYSPQVKVNAGVYSKHNYGEWNKILQATNGCLPLKFKMVNGKQGFTWTVTASLVTPLALTDKDFQPPH